MPGRSKKATTNRPLSRVLLSWCFRPKRLIVAALLASAWLFWPRVSERLPDLDSRPEYLVEIDRITVTPAPEWVPTDLVRDVLDRADIREPLSLLDPSLSEQVAVAFYSHPWIDDVRRVAKSFPPRLHVDVTYRKPVALVQRLDRYYPVDRSGYLLPGNDFAVSDIQRYPVIEGITSRPDSGQGQSWGDVAVAEAAELASVLMTAPDDGETLWQMLDLEAIEAPEVMGETEDARELQYVLRTAGGSQVLWGRSPGSQHPGELTVEKKVQRLVEYRQDYGSLDDAPDPYVIDIRGWNTLHRSRLADRDSAVR